MEKKINGLYKAVSILSYIIASLAIIVAIFGIIGCSTMMEELKNELYVEGIEELGYTMQEALDYAEMVETFVYVIFAFCFVSSGALIVLGVMFGKLSNIDDKTASEKFGKAITMCVFAFIFGGLLIGGLALGGLLSVQKKQKEAYALSLSQPKETNAEGETEQVSLEKIDKAQDRLLKLKNLKDNNAISEEEYQKLRENILSGVIPNKKQEQEKITEETLSEEEKKALRIARLDSLLESGAITQKEYDSLKSNIEK